MDDHMNPNSQQPKTDSAKHWVSFRPVKLLWLISAIFVVLLILLAASNHNRSKTNNTASVNRNHLASVSLTANGFVPQTITIKPGGSITFTNTDSSPHQVAADPYPKNNSIPGFDSTKLLQANDAYSFIFDKAGTYHLHDQLHPFDYHLTVLVR